MNILFPDQLAYLNSFSRNEDKLFFKMEKFALENNIPILAKASAEFLEQIIYISKPKSFLEIGTAIGYSTIRVAKLLNNNANIDTIEISKNNIELSKSFIKEANLLSRIHVLEGNALKIIPKLDFMYDFIFLDADKEDYLSLFELALTKLEIGGIILVDNLLWKGFAASEKVSEEYKKSTEFIKKFNAEFLNNPKLKSSILPIGDGLGLGIKIN